MPALAELGIGIGGDFEFSFANRNELEPACVEKAPHMRPRGRYGKHVSLAKPGNGLPDRQRGAQNLPIGVKAIRQLGGVRFAGDDGYERGRVRENHDRAPDRSSKNSLSATAPVGGGNGCAARSRAKRSRSGTASAIRSSSAVTAIFTASCLETP